MKSDKKKVSKQTMGSAAGGIKGTLKGFIDEVENTSTSLASEVKQHFDDLTERVSDVVGSAAETTVSMAEKVTIKDPADLVRGLLEEIKQASEVSLKVIGDRFDELRHLALSSDDKAPAKKASKKRTAKKKAAKKKAVKKTAAKKKVGKKAPAKKKAAKKKIAKKKVVKKVATKKKTAKKKTAKKAVAKKTLSTRKKTAGRKKAAAK